MIKFVKCLVIDDSQVKSGPADHGAVIGYIYAAGQVVVEIPLPTSIPTTVLRQWFHEGWVRISSPASWKQTGKAGWIEFAALRQVTIGDQTSERKQYLISVGGDEPPTITQL